MLSFVTSFFLNDSPNLYLTFFIIIIIYNIFSKIFHKIFAYINIRNIISPLFNGIFFIIFHLFPDFKFAQKGKEIEEEKFKKNKNEKKVLDNFKFKSRKKIIRLTKKQINILERKKIIIISWNLANFSFILTIFIILLIFSIFNIYKKFIIYKILHKYNSFIKLSIFLFFFIRTYSRSYEIIIAFFNDVTKNNIKNPLLSPSARVKLAVISLFETILNFAVLNYLFTKIKNDDFSTNLISGNHYLLNSLISSFGMSTSTAATLKSFTSVLQIITTLVIIIFALAVYLNSEEIFIKEKTKKKK